MFDFEEYLKEHRVWSWNTFGPGERTKGIIDHIKKELKEIEAAPDDVEEWVDVIILALDGALRVGHTPGDIMLGLITKQMINKNRKWPNWRTFGTDEAIEHIKGDDDA